MRARSAERHRMVETQIQARGVSDERVLRAMREVPREQFVEAELAAFAYEDGPLPIGEGQTISQPYIVALMLAAAAIDPGDRMLEVGAGSGYAAAVASRIAASVFAMERHASLGEAAAERIARLGYGNVELKVGDGSLGWPGAAPFDVILVSAGGPQAPDALKQQLTIGGRLLIPVGSSSEQDLRRVTRTGETSFEEESLGPVRFVPLVGAGGREADAPEGKP